MSSSRCSTKQKYPLLTDDYQERDQIIAQRCHSARGKSGTIKKKKRTTCIDGLSGEAQLAEALKRQRQKEKQHLQAWKRQRNTQKREK